MANPPISRIEFTSNSVVLIAGTQKFTFPFSTSTGAALSLPFADVQGMLTAVQSHGDQSVAAARDAILAAMASSPVETAPAPDTPTTTPPATTTPPPAAGQTLLNVGPTRAVREIADAIALMAPGGTIVADDAVYLKPFHTDVWDLTIKSASGNPYRCVLDGEGGNGGGKRLAYQKAMAHVGAQTTFIGIGFKRSGSPTSGTNYSNEAGLYAEVFAKEGVLKLVRCAFDDNGNGVFIPADPSLGGMIVYEEKECIFGYFKPNSQSNPANSGPSHDRYIGPKSVHIDGSMSFGCTRGHSVKSGAMTTLIENCPWIASWGGRAVEMPYGGTGTIRNTTLVSRNDDTADGIANGNFVGLNDENSKNGIGNMTVDGGQMLIGRSPSTFLIGTGNTVTVNPNVAVKYFGDGGVAVDGGGTLAGLARNRPAGATMISAPTKPPLPSWAFA